MFCGGNVTDLDVDCERAADEGPLAPNLRLHWDRLPAPFQVVWSPEYMANTVEYLENVASWFRRMINRGLPSPFLSSS